MDQVLALLGQPSTRERVPPNAELWHYPGGEIAFANGSVSYVSMSVPTRSTAPGPPEPQQPGADPSPPIFANPLGRTTAQDEGLSVFVVRQTRDGFVAVRDGPSTGSAEVSRVTPGMRIECASDPRAGPAAPAADWLWCPDLAGYIYRPLLAGNAAAGVTTAYRVRWTDDGFVAVRSKPTTSSGKRVAKLREGQRVLCTAAAAGEALAQGDQWLQCPSVGGWVYAPLLVPE